MILLAIYIVSSAFLAVIFKTFEVFDEVFLYLIGFCLGKFKPIFNDCRNIKDRISQEPFLNREGFVVLFHLFCGIYIFQDLRYELQILYLISIPLSFIKIFQYVKYLKEGPHKVVKKQVFIINLIVFQKLRVNNIVLNSNLTNLQQNKFRLFRKFFVVNPNTQFEYSQDGIQHLIQEPLYYQMNPVDLESFDLQFKLFYSQNALFQYHSVLIQYNKCYQLLGQFETDKIIIKYPMSAINRYSNTDNPSEFLSQYYSLITQTIIHRICFENSISEYVPINKKQLFYDLFDDFS